jgi:hypothetical protein
MIEPTFVNPFAKKGTSTSSTLTTPRAPLTARTSTGRTLTQQPNTARTHTFRGRRSYKGIQDGSLTEGTRPVYEGWELSLRDSRPIKQVQICSLYHDIDLLITNRIILLR